MSQKTENYNKIVSEGISNIKRNSMLWLLVLCSSVLLSIPFLWPHLGLVSLFGFIPLLAAEQIAHQTRKKRFWIYYYSCFLLWNLATTYWIYKATLPGAVAAVILNALQMAVIFRLFRWMRTLSKGFLPYLFLIITWLAWEHVYFTWDVSWPWLVLGNAFATSLKTIQWYEFTGALGGSLWVLLVNTLIFRFIQHRLTGKKNYASAFSIIALISIPIIISHILFYTYKEVPYEPSTGDGSRQFTVLQPNIDPYNDKFNGLSQREQNTILLKLADDALKNETVASMNKNSSPNPVADGAGERKPAYFVIAPESFISRYPLVLENTPHTNATLNQLWQYVSDYNKMDSLAPYNNLNLIVGAVTDYIYYDYHNADIQGNGLPPTETARYIKSEDLWYDRSNSAVFIDSKGGYEFYHKSKLVVLVENTPYKKLFKFMSRFTIDLGGAMGSYAPQSEREVFVTPDWVKIGTAICYESVYGDYYREYVLKGAQVMCIITNDGWWGNTPGYHQHLSYASLRAIETRRSIARSANTGISAYINQRGEIISQTQWWKPAWLNGTLNLNDRLTVFVKQGDIIGRVAGFLFFLFVLMGIVRHISKKYITKEVFTN